VLLFVAGRLSKVKLRQPICNCKDDKIFITVGETASEYTRHQAEVFEPACVFPLQATSEVI
jgi:hypothetical protein